MLGSSYSDARQALRALCPQPLLNWREARFYGRYGEVELHLLEFLCSRDKDAIDVGANDGSYVHFLRRHARRVIAFEPLPGRADALRRKFRRGVSVEAMALSDSVGTVALREAAAGGVAIIAAPKVTLDSVYDGNVGFIRVDVAGHAQAVLDGATRTIDRCRPRVMIRIEERLSPGALALVTAYFKPFDYQGFFVHAGFIEPIALFSPEIMQNARDLPTGPLPERPRFGRYMRNFIFLPREEPIETRHRMTRRLSQL